MNKQWTKARDMEEVIVLVKQLINIFDNSQNPGEFIIAVLIERKI